MLYFTAFDSRAGRSCGGATAPPAGTVLVKDIVPGVGSGYPSRPAVSSTACSTFLQPTFGTELWRSDGTAAGTVRVVDIQRREQLPVPNSGLTDVDGTFFFAATTAPTA